MIFKDKTIGSIFLLLATTMGGGILALPLVSVNMGFVYSVLALGITSLFTIFSALLVLELSLSMPINSSFNTFAKTTLGKSGQVIMNVAFLFVLYAVITAYISGASSLISVNSRLHLGINISEIVAAIVFTVILGFFVYIGIHAVDRVNKIFFSVIFLALFFTIIILLTNIDVANLRIPPNAHKYILSALPIFLTTFGFQSTIPSVVSYIGKNPKRLKIILIITPTIPFIVYTLWNMGMLGSIPRVGANSFQTILAQKSAGAVGLMVTTVNHARNSSLLKDSINIFANFVIVSGFLGISVGLFDFISDLFKRDKNKTVHKLQIAAITFLPPLLIAIFYPNIFVQALGFASIALALIGFILPAMMVYVLRKQKKAKQKSWLSKLILIAVFLFGVMIIILQLGA